MLYFNSLYCLTAFRLSGYPRILPKSLKNKPGGSIPAIDESLRLGNRVYFEQAKGRWLVEPRLVSVPKPGLPAIGRLPSISEVVIAHTALTAGIGCYQFPSTVLGGVTPKDLPEGISGFRDDGTNYPRILKEIMTNLRDLNTRRIITSTLRCLNPAVSSIELDSLREPKDVIVGHGFGEQTLSLPLAQESEGFRRFYAHLLALYQQPAKQTLIFEEPENGIYPGALALLTDEFKNAAAAGRGQVILTTHSPELLDGFAQEPEVIRAVELDGFQTRIGRVSREQREALEERLYDPGELLVGDPARIAETEPAAQ